MYPHAEAARPPLTVGAAPNCGERQRAGWTRSRYVGRESLARRGQCWFEERDPKLEGGCRRRGVANVRPPRSARIATAREVQEAPRPPGQCAARRVIARRERPAGPTRDLHLDYRPRRGGRREPDVVGEPGGSVHLEVERPVAIQNEVPALQDRATLRRSEVLSRCAVPAVSGREVRKPGPEETQNERGQPYAPAAAPPPRPPIREHPKCRTGERVHEASMTSTTSQPRAACLSPRRQRAGPTTASMSASRQWVRRRRPWGHKPPRRTRPPPLRSPAWPHGYRRPTWSRSLGLHIGAAIRGRCAKRFGTCTLSAFGLGRSPAGSGRRHNR
jgi:hypothetical protein